MAHDVFISHSSKDKPIADAVCAWLESEGVRCWIAPRDILPGADWGEAIVQAITRSRLVILIFSDNANRSQQIKREVERAASKEVLILPFRIENVLPSGALEYYLGTPHWLDALTPPMERHLRQLAVSVKRLLSAGGAESAYTTARRVPAGRPTPPPRPQVRQPLNFERLVKRFIRRIVWGAVVGGAIGDVFLTLSMLQSPRDLGHDLPPALITVAIITGTLGVAVNAIIWPIIRAFIRWLRKD